MFWGLNFNHCSTRDMACAMESQPPFPNIEPFSKVVSLPSIQCNIEVSHIPWKWIAFYTGYFVGVTPHHFRNCGGEFCAVKSGNPSGLVDESEPSRAALTVKTMGLDYIVLTTVDRDDLVDGGATQIAKTIRHIQKESPRTLIEILSSDFQSFCS